MNIKKKRHITCILIFSMITTWVYFISISAGASFFNTRVNGSNVIEAVPFGTDMAGMLQIKGSNGLIRQGCHGIGKKGEFRPPIDMCVSNDTVPGKTKYYCGNENIQPNRCFRYGRIISYIHNSDGKKKAQPA